MITVLLVDDHPVVRAGIKGMLAGEADIEVVGEAGSGEEAVAAVRALEPRVVLMDLRLPGIDGATATSEILAYAPQTRVVVLTTYDTDRDILRAVEVGAAGYLLKDASLANLLAGVRGAARGETVLAPEVATRLMTRLREPAAPALTKREVEVLKLVSLGLNNGEIGKRLHITEATVKTHLLRMYAKLGVNDRTAAVTTAMAIGAFSPS